MTRKFLPFLLPLLLVVFFVSNANAQTATDSASRLKQQLQLIQEQKKAAMTQARDDAKAMIQTKRDEFKAKLQVIKDQRRKTLVERIDAKLARVNKNQTERFTDVLSRLQGFLDKIGKSATSQTVLSDITSAQAAIDAAKTAVEAQAAKTYIIQITDDATLRLNVGTIISQFRQDLTATHKLVIDAKQAVQKLNADKSMMRKEATSSAKL